jgi:hypothetical protein
LWATKIKSTAEALGIAARPERSTQMLDDRLADSPVAALLVDLDAPETAFALIDHLRARTAGSMMPTAPEQDGHAIGTQLNLARPPAVTMIAFGPHVETDRLRMAKLRGADAVMVRGALHARLPEVLRTLANAQTHVNDQLTE